MLDIRTYCEACNKPLLPSADDAMICSFECTFCQQCVDTTLEGKCPNCGGNFQHRPIRPKHLLAKYPPKNKDVLPESEGTD